jgi:hypothetical protein
MKSGNLDLGSSPPIAGMEPLVMYSKRRLPASAPALACSSLCAAPMTHRVSDKAENEAREKTFHGCIVTYLPPVQGPDRARHTHSIRPWGTHRATLRGRHGGSERGIWSTKRGKPHIAHATTHRRIATVIYTSRVLLRLLREQRCVHTSATRHKELFDLSKG